ncbi:MAG: nitrate reductase molybdenum cofactor assembly chaperone [Alphaproteobacteria bacterium]|nr:nitrate reductase molybdenum cofactor assembly chaperone [Alphaproteobacteria bacterium]
MEQTYKSLSALLSYPTYELQCAMGEMTAMLASDGRLPPAQREALVRLGAEISQDDLIDVQSRYVDLFDRTRSLSLHLFEHVHGESRDRGQAMVSLLERYREAGFDIAAKQLPDYLPLFLEFLSLQSPEEAQTLLAEPLHILAALGERLKRRECPYAAVFDALVTLSQAPPARDALVVLQETDIEDPNDLVAIDRAWEESEVRFGPDNATSGDCPRAADLLRRIDGPEPSKTAEQGNMS